MDIYFNELCLNDEVEICYDDIRRMGHIYQLLLEYEISTCRITTNDLYCLLELIRDVAGSNPNAVNFIYSFMREPFEKNIDEPLQDAYIKHDWKYNDISCCGFAFAFLIDSLAYSALDSRWKHPVITIFKEDDMLDVRNIYDEETLQYHSTWLNSLKPIQLVKSLLSPSEKKIKLREDHGKDVLQEFGERLVKSEYVCGIINSLPFNSHRRKFISSIKEDGMIEIVLPWTDQGLGLVVQTTGRDIRETTKIAQLLKDEYGTL